MMADIPAAVSLVLNAELGPFMLLQSRFVQELAKAYEILFERMSIHIHTYMPIHMAVHMSTHMSIHRLTRSRPRGSRYNRCDQPLCKWMCCCWPLLMGAARWLRRR